MPLLHTVILLIAALAPLQRCHHAECHVKHAHPNPERSWHNWPSSCALMLTVSSHNSTDMGVFCRQSSMSGDSLTEPQASKEPSNLLNHHKLRTSHSERDLPNLIPSHPDGGTLFVYTLCFQCKVIRGHMG